VVAHALLDVPLGSQFVLRTVTVEILDPEAIVIGDQAVPAVVTFAGSQVRRNRGGVAYAVTGPAYCFIGGRPAARIAGTLGFLARDTYDELRADSGQARLGVPSGTVVRSDPQAVGRQFRENVVIGEVEGPPRTGSCRVVPLPLPAYFDRPLDHYPGMMIAEAARQLATLCASADASVPIAAVRIERVALDFVSFAELDPPLILDVVDWTDLDNGAEVTVAARQGARITSTCTFTILHHSSKFAS
jgi:hypothetical protein